MQAIGNHEFDIGLSPLQDFINNVTVCGGFDVLSANIYNLFEPGLTGYLPYIIKEVGDRKVGIIGYTTVNAPVLTKLGKSLNYFNIYLALALLSILNKAFTLNLT